MKLALSGGIAVAIIVAAAVVFAIRKGGSDVEPKPEPAAAAPQFEPGFREFVKNPKLWDELIESHEDVDGAIELAKKWNDDEVADATWHYVFETSKEEWALREILEALGPRVRPILLSYLRNPDLRERLCKPTKEKGLPESPFNRVCDLLGEDAPTEAVKLIVPFLDDPSAEIRKDGVLVLASIGTTDVIEPVRKALQDSDDYVRSYALMGLQRAVKGQRLSPACPRQLFDDIRQLVEDAKNTEMAAEVLLDFDERRAVEFMLSESVLSADFKGLHYVLPALNTRNLSVPRGRLVKVLSRLEEKPTKYPWGYQMGEVLRSLGTHKNPADRPTLEKYLSHEDEVVSSGAADGMLASYDLGDFHARLWKTLKAKGRKALTEAQRHVLAVESFDGQVRNGGLSQYFFNSSGDDWRHAQAGLETMGSKERLAILKQALAKFGPAGPSTERRKRMDQLARVANSEDSPFEKLDSRYYASKESVEVMVTRYVLKNPQAFR